MPDDLSPVPEDLGLGVTVRGFIAGQRLFDRYVLREILGRGGMGVVWLASDEHLHEDVALKFLPELVRLDTVSLEELKRETRRSRKLAHPNIVKVYDFTADAATAAISMEYVEGDTLSALRARKEHLCFDTSEIAAWVYQICTALAYAHAQARIVHRDLKPTNVMIDRDGQVKVTDFGISSSLSESVSRVTVKSGTSGTLAYMSPQQARGLTPSVSDDIYALGATLFELLTGKAPFYRGDLMHQLLHETAPRLAERRAELGVNGAPVPEAWETTIAACLAKEPSDRPQTIVEVVERLGLGSLGGYAPTATIEPPLPASSTIPEKSSSSGRLIGFSLAGLALLLLAGLGYYFGVMVPAEKVRQAEIAQQVALQQQKEAEARAATEAAEKARLEAEAQKAAAAAEALRTQQEKERREAERLANARGGLMLKTEPEGATVTLGGEDAQTSPATFKSVKLGSYPVHVTLDGYEPVDQTADIKENQFTDLGTITLVHSKGSLQVTSEPAGLAYTVTQDDKTFGSGQTPATVPDLPTGTYTVSVKKADWEIKDTVTIKRNETASYTPEFATGSVLITSTPPGATVVQGKKEVGKTPLTINDLRAGGVDFTLKLQGYKGASVEGTVITKQLTSLSAKLVELPPIPQEFRELIGTYCANDREGAFGNMRLIRSSEGSFRIFMNEKGKIDAEGNFSQTIRFSTGGNRHSSADITGVRWNDGTLFFKGKFRVKSVRMDGSTGDESFEEVHYVDLGDADGPHLDDGSSVFLVLIKKK